MDVSRILSILDEIRGQVETVAKMVEEMMKLVMVGDACPTNSFVVIARDIHGALRYRHEIDKSLHPK